jgi:hypothetical protein
MSCESPVFIPGDGIRGHYFPLPELVEREKSQAESVDLFVEPQRQLNQASSSSTSRCAAILAAQAESAILCAQVPSSITNLPRHGTK